MSVLICVPPDDTERVWPLVQDMIENAYAETDLFLPDVLSWLRDGKGLLWLAVEGDKILAALTTSLEPRPSGMSCRLVANGGHDIEQWKDHAREIEDYARAEGCVKVCFDGRRGWERIFVGYRPVKVTLEKAL